MIELSALLGVEWLMLDAPQPWTEAMVQRFQRLCVAAPSWDLMAANVVMLTVQAQAEKARTSA